MLPFEIENIENGRKKIIDFILCAHFYCVVRLMHTHFQKCEY